MTATSTKLLAAAGALTALLAANPALAQTARTVDQYTCKDVMRDNGSGREIATAFLHGFLLGKSGDTKFDLDVLYRQTDAFIERCLDNPSEKAVDAMAAVKK